MSTPSKADNQILELLDKNSGNVQAVANLIGMSESWVNRVKVQFWKPQDPELTAIIPVPEARPLGRTLPVFDSGISPDVDRVVALRTKTLDFLKSQLESSDIKPKEAIKLLEVLLSYENALRASMAPNINVINDNRKQSVHVTQLVDALKAGLSMDELRLVSGVDSPLAIIEGSYAPIGEEEDVQSTVVE